MDSPTTQNEEQHRSTQTLVGTVENTLVPRTLMSLWLTSSLYLRYVLLKEKNMLLTLEQEARRQRLQMPSPERLRKVSMMLKRHLLLSCKMLSYSWLYMEFRGCLSQSEVRLAVLQLPG